MPYLNSTGIAIHGIEVTTGRMIFRRLEEFVPRVGDEIRLDEDTFYTVTKVVWVYDEPDHPHHRVNLGLVLIGDAFASLKETEKG